MRSTRARRSGRIAHEQSAPGTFAMNRILRKLIPVSELPAELRSDFDPEAEVEIVGPAANEAPASKNLVEMIEEYRRTRTAPSPFGSPQDVVDYVRAVRDGGDLDPWLGPCTTSTPTF